MMWSDDEKREELTEALGFLSPEMDHDDWVRVGMALKTEGAPLEVWQSWSARDGRPGEYSPKACRVAWKSFDGPDSAHGGVTGKTIFAMAYEEGWRGPSATPSKVPAETRGGRGEARPAMPPRDGAPARWSEFDIEQERIYVENCRARFAESDGARYMEARGFNADVCDLYGVGYDAVDRRVVIPYPPGGWYHVDRTIDSDGGGKYRKPHGGPEPVFNVGVLDGAPRSVWIVEGALDCIAVEMSGAACVACVGASSSALVGAVVDYAARHEGPVYAVVALDADEDDGKGPAHQRAMSDELEGKGLRVIRNGGWRGRKDAAELYHDDAAALAALVRSVEVDPRAEWARQTLEGRGVRRAGPALADVLDGKGLMHPVATGIVPLDAAIGGGLPQGLAVLAAVSSTGKTALAMTIAANVARRGEVPVLYVTCEETSVELASRVVSRLASEVDPGVRLPASAVYDAAAREAMDDATESVMEAAGRRYLDEVDGRLFFLHAAEMTADTVVGAAQAVADAYGLPPLVIVDYLQLLAPPDGHEDDRRAVDVNLMRLRQWAGDNGAAVLLISALNRSGYLGQVSLDSAKESGGIEYAADLFLGLQPRGLPSKEDDGTDARIRAAETMRRFKADEVRRCEISILKNRHGAVTDGSGEHPHVRVVYDAVHNVFEEDAEGRMKARLI